MFFAYIFLTYLILYFDIHILIQLFNNLSELLSNKQNYRYHNVAEEL